MPAYQKAMQGDYALIHELQMLFSAPYEEQSKALEEKYYRLKPKAFFTPVAFRITVARLDGEPFHFVLHSVRRLIHRNGSKA